MSERECNTPFPDISVQITRAAYALYSTQYTEEEKIIIIKKKEL